MLELAIGIVGLALSVALFFLGEVRGRHTMQESMRRSLTLAGQLPAGRAGPQGMLPTVEFPAAVGYAEVGKGRGRQLLMMYGWGAHSMVLKVFDRALPGGEVEVVGRLFNGVGASFEVRDFDNDGFIEVGTLDYDLEQAPDRALAEACLQPVYFRWNADNEWDDARGERALPRLDPVDELDDARYEGATGIFEEVGRGETWDPLAGPRQSNGRPPEHIDRFLRQPSWVISLPHAD